MELIEFIFSGFWVFVGSLLIIFVPFAFTNAIIDSILKHRTIRKHGYPPEHCDANGEFKKEDKTTTHN